MGLSQNDKQKIADELLGTSGTLLHRLAEDYKVDICDIEEAAAECEVEKCNGCDWFVETSELDENGNCEDCRDE